MTTIVYPFILNGVNLLGIDSAQTPADIRVKIWKKLATDWKLDNIKDMQTIISLDDASHYLNKILKGKTIGRVIVDLNI